MLFKRNELRHLRLFYLRDFIIGLSSVMLPFMVIYFQNISFSLFQIGLFTAAFSISMVIFEIPTGAVADLYSRKKSILLGLLITGTALMLMGFVTNFYALIFIWSLAGIGMTFISGAEEAWVIDNLHKKKEKNLTKEYFIKSQSINSLGKVLAPLLGVFLVTILPLNYLWFFWAGGFFLGALVLLPAPEHYVPKKGHDLSGFYKSNFLQIKKGFQFIKTKKNIFYLFLAGIFLYFMMMAEDGTQPLLTGLGMPLEQLGLFYSLVALLMVFTPFLSNLFTNMKIKHAMSFTIVIRMIVMMSLLIIHPPLFYIAAMVLIVNQSLAGLRFPLLQTYLHSHVSSNVRATVTSAQSMTNQLAMAISLPIGGFLMDKAGVAPVMAYSSLIGLIAIFVYFRIKD